MFGLFIIEAAVYWQLEYGERSGDLAFTVEGLAEYAGTNGNECYVADACYMHMVEGFA